MTELSEKAGSYNFNDIGKGGEELRRLQLQASAAIDLEISMLTNKGLKKGDKILDLACGPGVITRQLAKNDPTASITGMDLNLELLEIARSEAKKNNINSIDFIHGDVYEPPLQDSQFDFIYARLLFQHLKDPKKALNAIYQLLKPGGRICIFDIDDDWLSLHPEPNGFKAFTETVGEIQSRKGGNRKVGRQLGSLVESSGYKNVTVDVQTISSRDIGMKAFLDITLGFKSRMLSDIDLAKSKKTLTETESLITNPRAWAFVGVFIAAGIREKNY